MAAVLVVGCSQVPTLLKHPQSGHVVQCSRAAFGLIPYLQVQEEHERCVRTAKESGYVEVSDSPISAKPPGPY